MVAPALIAAGGGLLSGILGSRGAKDAARTQRKTAKDQIKFSRQQNKQMDELQAGLTRRQITDAGAVRNQERGYNTAERDALYGITNRAADAMAGEAADAYGLNRRTIANTRDANLAMFQPTATQGRNALAAYGYNLGIGAKPQNYTGLGLSAGDRYLMETGVEDTFGGAAIRGTLQSGATLDALERMRSGIAAQSRNQQQSELFALGGMGEAATANMANIRTGAAGDLTRQRELLAAGRVGASDYRARGLSNAESGYAADQTATGQNWLSTVGNARVNRANLAGQTGAQYQTNALTAMANRGDAGAAGAIGAGNAWAEGLNTAAGLYGYLRQPQTTTGAQTPPMFPPSSGGANPNFRAWASRFGL